MIDREVVCLMWGSASGVLLPSSSVVMSLTFLVLAVPVGCGGCTLLEDTAVLVP